MLGVHAEECRPNAGPLMEGEVMGGEDEMVCRVRDKKGRDERKRRRVHIPYFHDHKQQHARSHRLFFSLSPNFV